MILWNELYETCHIWRGKGLISNHGSFTTSVFHQSIIPAQERVAESMAQGNHTR